VGFEGEGVQAVTAGQALEGLGDGGRGDTQVPGDSTLGPVGDVTEPPDVELAGCIRGAGRGAWGDLD